MAIIKELFRAYYNNKLPVEGGYIICSFFDAGSTYTRYEVTSYNNVKDIYQTDEGITFQADGKKMFVLVEPANYPKKHTEPAYRDGEHKIPYRFNEVETHVSKRQDRIMVGRKPVMTYTSFTILKPQGNNFSYILYETDDLVDVVKSFFLDTLWKDANVPRIDAEKTTGIIQKVFRDFINYKIE